MSKRLIVVRAGDNSLHPQWGAGDWDIINAYYGDSSPEGALAIKGGKWDGIYKVFQQKPELLDQYQTIWLPDDDIQTNAADIERMFTLHEQYNLKLSQPALSWNSFALHWVLLQNPKFILRYSNFVEIMMPCFSTALLRKVLPLFENNRTGTFFDAIWHRLCDEPYEAAAILDSVKMRHSRPVAGTQGSIINKENKEQDILTLRKKTGAVPKKLLKKLPHPLFYGGVLQNGKTIKGTKKTSLYVFLGFASQVKRICAEAHIGSGFSKRGVPFMLSRMIRHVLLYHLFNKPDLTKLKL